MKKIYIVLSYTGTILSRIVKFYTKKEYSHVSISLDENLEQMYSFGRKHAYNPFYAGFVQESPHYGTFKRFKNTKTKIYSMEVSNSDYQKIKDAIEEFKKHENRYRFNMMGIVAILAHYHLKREKYFYCAEFVKYVLDHSDLDLDLPEMVKPDDFQKMEGLDVIYTGRMRDYHTL